MEIDGVFSGGGLKGLALVGACKVFEEKGYTFKRTVGTSAGAIVAAMLAAGYTAREMEEIMQQQNFPELLDARKTFIPIPFMKWLQLYWRMGLYQGTALENWFSDILAEKGVYTFADLPEGSLKIIVSDLTNGKLIVLPDDLGEYGLRADFFPVARALRMSTSIPFFFEPVVLHSLAGNSVTVDGGVLSNFPLWMFNEPDNGEMRPIVGMKLSHNPADKKKTVIRNGLGLYEALFTTMKDAHDEKHVSKRLEKDVLFIPTDGISAVQFDLSDEQKDTLVISGEVSATNFLKNWGKIALKSMVI
ncbi:patatin-like phospholipase family protein [Sporosarcina gallistercoris]|uniref:Patatin-like phospholipase family protein n=1 Tax=Sporosarcina gallistercoris TaxID=2762245 RepID=A0ABR8PJI3_9BACL|nr:patatin-like phospholipase family protein [Sporosarcina gallistercoris]MBD7908305.1 patatin-like phospholipase family protein [Sporosarcina gallistercoris]